MTNFSQGEPSLHELRRRAKAAQVAAATAQEELRIACNRLEGSARPVCSKCLHLRYSVEFRYTFCDQIGDASGRFRPLSDVATLIDGKFVCRYFKAGGELEGTP